MELNYKFSTIEKIFLVLLFAFAISLFNMAGYILTVIVFCFFLVYGWKSKMDSRTLVLMIFSVFYFTNYCIYFAFGIKEVITFFIAPWSCYLIGKEINRKYKNKNGFKIFIFVLVAGFFLHGVLNLYSYISIYGYDYGYRIAYDFWRHEEISVTGCALYFIPMMSLSLGYIFSKHKLLYKFVAVLFLGICIWANVIFANRTPIYILFIIIAIKVVSVVFKYRHNVKVYIASVAVLAMSIICWVKDIAGVRTLIIGLTITDRMTGEDIGRLPIWVEFLKSDWWKYPLGGEQVELRYSFVHNLWLDTLWSVGFIPFICLVVFSIMCLKIIRDYYRGNGKLSMENIYLLIGLGISCMVEPIINSNPYYFLLVIFIIASIDGYMKNSYIQREWVNEKLEND